MLNWWFLLWSWHFSVGFLLFCAACDGAVGTKDKQKKIDDSVNDAASGCSKSGYSDSGFVFAYALTFIWLITLNIWHLYVQISTVVVVSVLPNCVP